MVTKKALVQSRNRAQQNRLQEIENIRACLPITEYLLLVHAGITTGQVPILDDRGRPTGEFTCLDGKERVALLMKMVGKALPDRPSTPGEMGQAEPTLEEIQKIASNPDEIALLSIGQLEEMEVSIKKAKEGK